MIIIIFNNNNNLNLFLSVVFHAHHASTSFFCISMHIMHPNHTFFLLSDFCTFTFLGTFRYTFDTFSTTSDNVINVTQRIARDRCMHVVLNIEG